MTNHLLRLGTAAALVVLSSMPSFAQMATSSFNCVDAAVNLDADLDGFFDSEECGGLGGLPVCNGTTPRSSCIDPNGRDVFVMFVPALPTNLPPDSLSLINQDVQAGGLNIAAHAVTVDKVQLPERLLKRNDGTVTTQKVIRLTESRATGSGILGVMEHGTPNGLDDGVVYTERAKIVAADMRVSALDVLLWVINHEVAHAVYLTAFEDPYRGHHEVEGSGTVMMSAMTRKSGPAKQFSEGSRVDVRLK